MSGTDVAVLLAGGAWRSGQTSLKSATSGANSKQNKTPWYCLCWQCAVLHLISHCFVRCARYAMPATDLVYAGTRTCALQLNITGSTPPTKVLGVRYAMPDTHYRYAPTRPPTQRAPSLCSHATQVDSPMRLLAPYVVSGTDEGYVVVPGSAKCDDLTTSTDRPGSRREGRLCSLGRVLIHGKLKGCGPSSIATAVARANAVATAGCNGWVCGVAPSAVV